VRLLPSTLNTVNRLGGARPSFTDPPGERDFAAAGELDLEKVEQEHPAGHSEVTGLQG